MGDFFSSFRAQHLEFPSYFEKIKDKLRLLTCCHDLLILTTNPLNFYLFEL